MLPKPPLALLAAAILSPFPLASASSSPLQCRPPGPLVPRPRNMTSHPLFHSAISRLTSSLDSATKPPFSLNPGFDINNVSFSIGLIAHDQGEEEEEEEDYYKSIPAWEYHHLAPGNVEGTKNLDRDSEYLIGSISKVFTDYLVLRSGVDLDRAVTDFIPELRDRKSKIRWEEITLRMLGGHMSGIPPNYGFSEYFYLSPYFQSLGFPGPLPNSTYPPCGVTGLNKGCTRQQFLSGLLEIEPVTPLPETRPVYSNIAFTLLSYAVSDFLSAAVADDDKEQEKEKKDYASLLASLVTKPWGLDRTRVSDGTENSTTTAAAAVIPPGPNSWGSDYADGAPGGGLISSLSDLCRFFVAVLDRTALDTETEVLRWLKPNAGVVTGSVGSLVGFPWEVYRVRSSSLFFMGKTTEKENYERTRTIDIYGKGGGAYGYASQVGLVDELGFGVVVLTAGGSGGTMAVQAVYDAVLQEMVGGVDGVARAQAEERYVGVWEEEEGEEEGNKVKAKFEMDGRGEGVVLTGLERGGKDILEGYKEIWNVTVGQFMAGRLEVARVFPVGVVDYYHDDQDGETTRYPAGGGGGGEEEVEYEEWRIDWQMDWTGESELPGAGGNESVSRDNCLGWTLTDWIHYGGEALDKIVFVKEKKTGKVVGVEVPFLRSGVLRKKKKMEEEKED